MRDAERICRAALAKIETGGGPAASIASRALNQAYPSPYVPKCDHAWCPSAHAAFGLRCSICNEYAPAKPAIAPVQIVGQCDHTGHVEMFPRGALFVTRCLDCKCVIRVDDKATVTKKKSDDKACDKHQWWHVRPNGERLCARCGVSEVIAPECVHNWRHLPVNSYCLICGKTVAGQP